MFQFHKSHPMHKQRRCRHCRDCCQLSLGTSKISPKMWNIPLRVWSRCQVADSRRLEDSGSETRLETVSAGQRVTLLVFPVSDHGGCADRGNGVCFWRPRGVLGVLSLTTDLDLDPAQLAAQRTRTILPHSAPDTLLPGLALDIVPTEENRTKLPSPDSRPSKRCALRGIILGVSRPSKEA